MVLRWLAVYGVANALGCQMDSAPPVAISRDASTSAVVDARVKVPAPARWGRNQPDCHGIVDLQPPGAPDIDPKKWLIAHGARQPIEDSHHLQGYGNSGDCVELRVGPAHERALACLEENDNSADEGYWAVFSRVILVVRGHKIVKLLDVPLSFVHGDVEFTAMELELQIADDGSSATLVPDHCRACPVDVTKQPASAGFPTFDDVVRDMCAATGIYRWRDGRFRQVPRG